MLILRGRLSRFYHKQLAQEAVAGMDGVEQIINEIEVVKEAQIAWRLEQRSHHVMEESSETQAGVPAHNRHRSPTRV